MKRLSTHLTPLWKIFPFIPIGWLLILFARSAFSGELHFGDTRSWILGGILFVTVEPFLLWLCLPLKIVYENGAELVVSNMFRSTKIPISQIKMMNGPDFSTLNRLTIYLNESSTFGKKIVFSPPLFQAGKVVSDLRRQLNQIRF
jgi:hypothetical protein